MTFQPEQRWRSLPASRSVRSDTTSLLPVVNTTVRERTLIVELARHDKRNALNAAIAPSISSR